VHNTYVQPVTQGKSALIPVYAPGRADDEPSSGTHKKHAPQTSSAKSHTEASERKHVPSNVLQLNARTTSRIAASPSTATVQSTLRNLPVKAAEQRKILPGRSSSSSESQQDKHSLPPLKAPPPDLSADMSSSPTSGSPARTRRASEASGTLRGAVGRKGLSYLISPTANAAAKPKASRKSTLSATRSFLKPRPQRRLSRTYPGAKGQKRGKERGQKRVVSVVDVVLGS
jgi:hypothetical protein